MKRTIGAFFRFFILLICCISLKPHRANASHLYGADLYYTHVANNTYNITMVIYGDCNINFGSTFLTLASSTPHIDIYNGTNLYTSITLSIQNPSAGTEVTPVCASQLSNTTCVSTTGTVPGVKKFTYTGSVTLNTTSASWRFRFNGSLANGTTNTSAGRSNSISTIIFPTNPPNPPGSIMELEATLNNTNGPNSSPVFTTIPTPFFCINKAASYNPGAVDPNNDVLNFSLVPGLEGATGGNVSYVSPYSATVPLAAATGTMSFSGTNGQFNFTPTIGGQRALVVNKVEEYRNSVFVGSSMREMTFVILANCNNNPPEGTMSSANGGTISTDGLTFTACPSSGTVSFNINPVDIDGNSINVAATGIPAGASFNVTNNNTIAPAGAFSWNISSVAPGTYNFFITYTDNGCPLSSKQTIAYSIVVLPQPKITYALISPATCSKKAVFSITPSNATSPYTFTVFQGTSTIHTINNITSPQLDSLVPGTYTFRLIAGNSCYKDTSITIAPPPAIIPSVVMTKPICNGANNGTITINASGGQTPFQYALGAGAYSSANTFTGLAAGTYTLHIKDANDCIKDTTVILEDALSIVANITFQKPPCNFYNSGQITVTASNGTAPYQYALGAGPFSSVNTWSGLYSGTYVIHIKDANNCLKDSVFILPDSVKVHATAVITHVLCNGASTGVITLNAYGTGATPYVYKLGSGTLSTVNTFPNLPAGTHSFHIEDDNQCYLDTNVVINEPTPITSTSVVTNVLCNGQSNGSVTITVAGGISPYTYAIGAGPYSSGNTFAGLAAGTYTLHVKDFNNCIKDTNIIVTEPAVLAITNLAITNAKCNGSSDGTVTVTAAGGTIAYQYAVNAGIFQASNILTGLPAGTHTIHVKDANNCTKDTVITITEPTPIIPSASVKQSTCLTLSDGKVILSATGGTPPYQYAVGLNPYSSSATFTPLAAGIYIFHIRDANLCVKDTAIVIADSMVLKFNVTVTDAKCFDSSSGSITVNNASGGTSPYTYSLGIGPFGSSNVFNNKPAATYIVNMKDDVGCRKDTTVVINQPAKLVPQITISSTISCFGFNDGIVIVGATGGTPAYTFARDAGAFGASGSFINLYAGTYIFRVKDNNGCNRDTTVTLTQPPQLDLTNVVVTDVLCYGDSSGTATVTGTGGTLPYSYRTDFNAFQASNVLTGIKAGQHTVRMQDAEGCFADTTINVTQPSELVIGNINITHPTCEGFRDGSVSLQGGGASSPYQYGVNNSNFTSNNTIGGLVEGTYTFHVRDNKGCIRDTILTLKGYPHILINEILTTATGCFGGSDGSIDIDAQGGVQPLMYMIDNGSPVPNNVFTGLKQGTYTITIVDSKNCSKDTVVSVTSPDKLTVKTTSTGNDCEGMDKEASVLTEVKGGTEPYSYEWNINVGNVPTVSGVGNGSYKVRVSDANGCTDSSIAIVSYDNCCKPLMPDAFTPNGDGFNDKIKMLYKGDIKLIDFMIYNRFGQQVFQTTNLSDAWDGTFMGQPQDLGVYNYLIRIICGNRGTEEQTFKGTITLIR